MKFTYFAWVILFFLRSLSAHAVLTPVEEKAMQPSLLRIRSEMIASLKNVKSTDGPEITEEDLLRSLKLKIRPTGTFDAEDLERLKGFLAPLWVEAKILREYKIRAQELWEIFKKSFEEFSNPISPEDFYEELRKKQAAFDEAKAAFLNLPDEFHLEFVKFSATHQIDFWNILDDQTRNLEVLDRFEEAQTDPALKNLVALVTEIRRSMPYKTGFGPHVYLYLLKDEFKKSSIKKNGHVIRACQKQFEQLKNWERIMREGKPCDLSLFPNQEIEISLPELETFSNQILEQRKQAKMTLSRLRNAILKFMEAFHDLNDKGSFHHLTHRFYKDAPALHDVYRDNFLKSVATLIPAFENFVEHYERQKALLEHRYHESRRSRMQLGRLYREQGKTLAAIHRTVIQGGTSTEVRKLLTDLRWRNFVAFTQGLSQTHLAKRLSDGKLGQYIASQPRAEGESDAEFLAGLVNRHPQINSSLTGNYSSTSAVSGASL